MKSYRIYKYMKLLAFLAFAATGCTQIVVNRIGGRYPSKAPTCDVSFEYLNTMDASLYEKYELVGSIGLAGNVPDEFTPEVKEKLRPEACRLGADVVSFMGHGSSGMGNGASFGVYVIKNSKPEKKPKAQRSL